MVLMFWTDRFAKILVKHKDHVFLKNYVAAAYGPVM
jgi:hypothetical protein